MVNVGPVSRSLYVDELLRVESAILEEVLSAGVPEVAPETEILREATREYLNHGVIPDGWEDEIELLEALEQQLSEFSPPFCEFGLDPQSGQVTGFWPARELLEDAIDAGEMMVVKALSEAQESWLGYILHSTENALLLWLQTESGLKLLWRCTREMHDGQEAPGEATPAAFSTQPTEKAKPGAPAEENRCSKP